MRQPLNTWGDNLTDIMASVKAELVKTAELAPPATPEVYEDLYTMQAETVETIARYAGPHLDQVDGDYSRRARVCLLGVARQMAKVKAGIIHPKHPDELREPFADALRLYGDTLELLADEAMVAPAPMPLPPKPDDESKPEGETQRTLYETIRELGGTSEANRIKKADIIKRSGYAEGSTHKPLADMVNRGVLHSQSGKHGGYWIGQP